jgi:1-phosphofructokinase family hexose kinase
MIFTVTLNPALDRTLTVPRLALDEVLRAAALRLDWGGKGFNVSRALKALGTESVALGLVGGATGQLLERGLRSLGISTDLTPIAGETRTNVVIADGEHYVKVNETGPTVRAEELAAFISQALARAGPGDVWVLSGNLPPGVPDHLYAQLIPLLRERGAHVSLDTSGEPLRLGCAAAPHLVKPNRAEAESLLGRAIRSEADLSDAAAFFLRQGTQLVALSLGSDGLLLASDEEAVRAWPPPVPAGHTVGAGDALLAGILWAQERGLPLSDMARWGVAAGAAAATHNGVGIGARDQVDELYQQTRVVSLGEGRSAIRRIAP